MNFLNILLKSDPSLESKDNKQNRKNKSSISFEEILQKNLKEKNLKQKPKTPSLETKTSKGSNHLTSKEQIKDLTKIDNKTHLSKIDKQDIKNLKDKKDIKNEVYNYIELSEKNRNLTTDKIKNNKLTQNHPKKHHLSKPKTPSLETKISKDSNHLRQKEQNFIKDLIGDKTHLSKTDKKKSIKKDALKLNSEKKEALKDFKKSEITIEKDNNIKKEISTLQEKILISKSKISNQDVKYDTNSTNKTQIIDNTASNTQFSNTSHQESFSQNPDHSNSYTNQSSNFNLQNETKQKNSFFFKVNDVIINATMKNHFLTLSLQSTGSLLLTSGLESEIKSILNSSGFKNFNLTIKDREKKIYIDSSKNINQKSEKSKIYVLA